jgi:hypothetical protein
MTQYCKTFGSVVLTVVMATSAAAQSLGEIARKEEARRKSVKEAGKVYTNDSVRGAESAAAPVPVTLSTPEATPPSPSGTQQEPNAKPTTKPDEPKKDEAYWRGRMTEVRDGLARAQTLQEALQSRINALNADFVNRDDPVQRSKVASDRQKALAELERVKQEIQQLQKAITDSQEEARRAGVPPGWVR